MNNIKICESFNGSILNEMLTKIRSEAWRTMITEQDIVHEKLVQCLLVIILAEPHAGIMKHLWFQHFKTREIIKVVISKFGNTVDMLSF